MLRRRSNGNWELLVLAEALAEARPARVSEASLERVRLRVFSQLGVQDGRLTSGRSQRWVVIPAGVGLAAAIIATVKIAGPLTVTDSSGTTGEEITDTTGSVPSNVPAGEWVVLSNDLRIAPEHGSVVSFVARSGGDLLRVESGRVIVATSESLVVDGPGFTATLGSSTVTTFDVRERDSLVTVLEGEVSLMTAAGTSLLLAGEHAVVLLPDSPSLGAPALEAPFDSSAPQPGTENFAPANDPPAAIPTAPPIAPYGAVPPPVGTTAPLADPPFEAPVPAGNGRPIDSPSTAPGPVGPPEVQSGVGSPPEQPPVAGGNPPVDVLPPAEPPSPEPASGLAEPSPDGPPDHSEVPPPAEASPDAPPPHPETPPDAEAPVVEPPVEPASGDTPSDDSSPGLGTEPGEPASPADDHAVGNGDHGKPSDTPGNGPSTDKGNGDGQPGGSSNAPGQAVQGQEQQQSSGAGGGDHDNDAVGAAGAHGNGKANHPEGNSALAKSGGANAAGDQDSRKPSPANKGKSPG